MADIVETLTAGTYLATKRDKWSTEIVETDGGFEFRNQRWETPLAEWDITIPFCKRDSAKYTSAVALINAAKGSLNSFSFHDPVACEDVDVRILEDSMSFTPDGNLVQIEFSVREVREP